MAKRYTDTEKWKKQFIKSLPAEYKLFYLFILDECDHAGIWHIEMEVAEARLGIKLSLDKIRGLFNERVVEFDGGSKMFIPDFIDFQYGELNPANKVHKSVIDRLAKYKLKGLARGLEAPMDKDKDKDIVFSIEQCLEISLKDERWVNENKTNRQELMAFNSEMIGTGQMERNPADYKRHFYHWKKNGKLGNALPVKKMVL